MAKQLMTVDTFKQELATRGNAIQSMLPPQIDLKRFQRITLTAIQKNPSLVGKNKLFDAVLDCAKDGLIPDGREAALVPFGSDVAYMPMVAGILKKIRQSGELKSLSAQVVYKNDEFDYWTDENGVHFKHKPVIIGEPGDIVGVYAVAVTKDEGTYFEFLNMEEVNKIKASSKNTSLWTKWSGEMMKKTAIRRLSKRLPMSTDIETTIHQDDQFYSFENTEPEIVTEPKKKVKNVTNAESVKKELQQNNNPEPKRETENPDLEIF